LKRQQFVAEDAGLADEFAKCEQLVEFIKLRRTLADIRYAREHVVPFVATYGRIPKSPTPPVFAVIKQNGNSVNLVARTDDLQ
jgi:hypothetical protein